MSRYFSNSSDILTHSGWNLDISTEGTVVVWYLPTTADNDGVSHVLFIMNNSSPTRRWWIVHGGDNVLYLDWHNNGTDRFFGRTVGNYGWSTTSWNCIFWNWNSSRMDIRLNGGANVGGWGQGALDDLAARWDTSASGTNYYIGNDPAGSNQFSGYLEYVTIWNTYLPLEFGEYMWVDRRPPNEYYEENIVFCSPLEGLFSPEPDWSVGQRSLSITGASGSQIIRPPLSPRHFAWSSPFAQPAVVAGDLMPFFNGLIPGFGAGVGQ